MYACIDLSIPSRSSRSSHKIHCILRCTITYHACMHTPCLLHNVEISCSYEIHLSPSSSPPRSRFSFLFYFSETRNLLKYSNTHNLLWIYACNNIQHHLISFQHKTLDPSSSSFADSTSSQHDGRG